MFNQIPRAAALVPVAVLAILTAVSTQTHPPALAKGGNNPPAGPPAISGEPKAGELLTANTTAISDPDGTPDGAFTYQWFRTENGADLRIDGADGRSYIPWDGDVGKNIRVQVAYTDQAGNLDGPLTSPATAAVSSSSHGPVMWSATVTAANLGDKRHGYSAVEGDEGGSISNDNFTYRGGQFTILRVRSADEWEDEGLVCDVSNDSTGGHHLSWTIIVNDRKGENLSTARRHYATYTRHRRNNVGAHWHDGQKLAVAVRMNDTGAYGKPMVGGTPKVGMRLTADRTTIIDPNDLPNSLQDFNHQWMRSTGGPLPHVPGASRHWLDSRERPHVIIPGATGRTHILTADDFGRTIKAASATPIATASYRAPYTARRPPRLPTPPHRKRSRWTTPTRCRLPMTYIRPAQRRTP